MELGDAPSVGGCLGVGDTSWGESSWGRLELRTETWKGTDGAWYPRRGGCGVTSREAEEKPGHSQVKRQAEEKRPERSQEGRGEG